LAGAYEDLLSRFPTVLLSYLNNPAENCKGFLLQRVQSKKEWALSPEAFEQLLLWLDEGRNSGGERYLEMRRRLVAYFDRKRCLTPNELADDTLNRVARRLTEQGIEDSPAKYCYIIARYVFLEYLRDKERENVPLDLMPEQPRPDDWKATERVNDEDAKEAMLSCLETCISELSTANRNIILGYYAGNARIKIENRRSLAQSLGITMNALSIRACRIRDKLEACVRHCLQQSLNVFSESS
jgi:DNA-directed RNA polymerase specialized sigma24 family protein